ncbi:hypothetical protein L917_03564, partial [Phytophthora nicotianae]
RYWRSIASLPRHTKNPSQAQPVRLTRTNTQRLLYK